MPINLDHRKRLKELIVYQRMMDLVKITYTMTEKLPKSEEFSLKNQMKRAVVSIISNFAEGYMRSSSKDKIHFIEMSDTSHDELDTQADICHELKYWDDNDWSTYLSKSAEVSYLSYRYKQAINN